MDYLTPEALREKTTYIAVIVTRDGKEFRVPVIGTPEDRRHLGVWFDDAGLKSGFFIPAPNDVPAMTVAELEDKFLAWWRGQTEHILEKCGDLQEVAR